MKGTLMLERPDTDLLEIYFPKDRNKIVPEPLSLLPYKELKEFRYKLKRTGEWKNLQHLPIERRTIQLSLSKIEQLISIVHAAFSDPGTLPEKRHFSSDQRATVTGSALHECFSLCDLWRQNRFTIGEIGGAFPTYKEGLLLPYVDALSERNNGFTSVWQRFHTDDRLVDTDKDRLPEEFRDLPLSLDKQEQLEIRASNEVYEAGLALGQSYFESQPRGYGYSEVLSIWNFQQLSSYGNTRIQIPVRFDQIRCVTDGNDPNYVFVDLKTGKQKMDYPQKFQALLMKFLAGHFTGRFLKGGYLSRVGSPFVSRPPIKTIAPPRGAYDLEYFHFNLDGKATHLPINIDFNTDNDVRELFFEWLAFYSDVFVAFKEQLASYLKYGTGFGLNLSNPVQQELPLFMPEPEVQFVLDLSNIPPRPRLEKKGPEKHKYVIGESELKEECEKCHEPIKEFCIVRRRGPKKSRIYVRHDCGCHKHRDYKKMNVDSDLVSPST